MDKKTKITIILNLVFALTYFDLYRVGFAHHRNFQETVCFLYTDWDPPIDSRCIKEGENSSGIPVFLCCGPE